MKSLPHARLLLALTLGLLCSSALAPVVRLAPTPTEARAAAPSSASRVEYRVRALTGPTVEHARALHERMLHALGYHPGHALRPLQVHAHERLLSAFARSAHQVVHIQQLRSERRLRFEQAPLYSHRLLLPQFVLCDDAPDDEDLADIGAEQLKFFPQHAQPSLDVVALSPRLPPRDQIERPPRA